MPRKNVAGTASDPVIDFVPLEIDGKHYKVCWDYNAIADAEAACGAGINLLHGVGSMFLGTATAVQHRALLFAALQKAHPDITLLEAGSLLRMDTIPSVRLALMTAYNEAMPEKKRMIITVEPEEDSLDSQIDNFGSRPGPAQSSPSD